MKQLHEDIIAAWKQLQTKEGQPTTPLPATWEHNLVGPCMQHWLITRTTTELEAVLTFDNPFDKRSHKQSQTPAEPMETDIQCETCMKFFKTGQALSVHKVKAHGERNKYRSQVSTAQCPGCDKMFSNKQNAQSHWAKQICVRNATAIRTYDEVEALQTQTHELQPQPQSMHGNGPTYDRDVLLALLGIARRPANVVSNLAADTPGHVVDESIRQSPQLDTGRPEVSQNIGLDGGPSCPARPPGIICVQDVAVSGQAGNTLPPQGTSGDAVTLEGTAGC